MLSSRGFLSGLVFLFGSSSLLLIVYGERDLLCERVSPLFAVSNLSQ